jgi:CPA1 family monovalent cation:H+ antiporter
MLGGNAQDRVRHREMQRVERRLRLAGLRAERAALFRLRRDRQIEDGMLRRLVREIDLLEQRFRG